MMEVIILALQLLIPILPSVQSQPLTVFWRGNDITNKPTLIYHDEVEPILYSPPPRLVNPNGTRGPLCSSTVGPIAWYPGNGAMIGFAKNRRERVIYQIIPNGNLTAQIVRDGRVDDISGSPTFDYHNGLFTCRRNGDISTAVPVGFYMRNGQTVRGVIRITGVSITSNSFMAASPSFTLAGDTQDGPPENYTWTRNGAPITNNNSFSISVGVNGVTAAAYDLSRYRSTLTVTGTLPGVYQYSVSNRATTNSFTSNINIEGAGATAPSNLIAQQNGVGSILVSWTLPSLRPVDGYRISTQSPPDFSAGINVGRDDSSRQIILRLGMHSISIKARSRHYPGMVVSVPVTVRAFESPNIMPPSVTANSVTLSWAQPEGTLPSQNYVVSLQRGTNQQFCSDETDSRQMTTNDQSVVFSNLYGSSSYNVTVIARAFGTSMMMSQEFMTPASSPVGVPQRIRPSTTSRTITVNWDEITCRERNGAITNYLVELKKEGVGEPIPGMLMINERRFFADGSQIIPFTNYTFRVAGRNMQGQGPYSEIMTIQTMGDTPGPVSTLRSKVRFTSIEITWDRPREPNGIILRYEIVYRVNDNTSPITESTTNPNDTITIKIPALTLGTRVSVSVSAYTSVGQGPPANLTNLVTPTETPVVEGVQLETIDQTSVQVSWDRIPLDEITNYTVYYRPVGSQACEMAVVVPGSQVSVEIQNLQAGMRYRFQVEATALLEDGRRLTGQRSPVVRQDTTNPTPTEGQNCGRDLSIAVIVSILLTIITYTAIMLVVLYVCLRKKKNGNVTGKEDTYVAATDNSFRMSRQEEMDMKACVAYAQFPSAQTPASHEGAETLYDNV